MSDLGEITVLNAGTTLYHGTSRTDFDETRQALEGPSWLSNQREVAEHFASRHAAAGGQARVIAYRLTEDLTLPVVMNRSDFIMLAAIHDIDVGGVNEMRESVVLSGLPGWIIPNSYGPGNADILLKNTDCLAFVETFVPTPSNAEPSL